MTNYYEKYLKYKKKYLALKQQMGGGTTCNGYIDNPIYTKFNNKDKFIKCVCPDYLDNSLNHVFKDRPSTNICVCKHDKSVHNIK